MIARREEEQILAEKKNAFSLECSKEMLHAKQEQEISDRKYREELERLKRQARERRVCMLTRRHVYNLTNMSVCLFVCLSICLSVYCLFVYPLLLQEKERLRKEAEERDEVEMRTVGIERESQDWQERAARIEQERVSNDI